MYRRSDGQIAPAVPRGPSAHALAATVKAVMEDGGSSVGGAAGLAVIQSGAESRYTDDTVLYRHTAAE